MKINDVRKLLQRYRESAERRSDEILEAVEPHLHKLYKQSWGNELWLVFEQICVASLDCYRLDIFNRCYDVLENQFPGSSRVKKLLAQKHEAMEHYIKATAIYDEILESENQESNTFCMKRKIAILLARNRIVEAIKQLIEYLSLFQTDSEAWLELSSLYVRESDYSKAAFCLEELILINPYHHAYHQRYADIRYTLGGAENLEISRRHFAHAFKLNSNNMRALYGLYLASNNLANSPKVTSKCKKDSSKYAAWAAKMIAKNYSERSGIKSQLKSVTNMLESFQIST